MKEKTLTNDRIAKMPSSEKGKRPIYYDLNLPGFGIRVTEAGIKSYVVNKRVDGKAQLITIGRWPSVRLVDARKIAQEHMGMMAGGTNPITEKKKQNAKSLTLETAFHEFEKARGKSLRPKTLKEYQRIMEKHFGDWKRRAIIEIDKDMVGRRHTQITESSGPGMANLSFRVLRAVLNLAKDAHEGGLLENPVGRLSATKAWNRIDRRKTIIKADDIPAWWEAVESLADNGPQGEVIRDYLQTLALTGLRRNEGAGLKVRNIDLTARTLTVPVTKNKEPHTLPIGKYLHGLLERRIQAGNGRYVFPDTTGDSHIIDVRKAMVKVVAASGVEFVLHDLRRGFASLAESLDISGYTLKRLLNHKIDHDVTGGYISFETERLRLPMQKIEDKFLKLAGVTPGAKVIQLKPKQGGA